MDSSARMLAEAHRFLKLGGRLVIGFIDGDSDLGQHYLAHCTCTKMANEDTGEAWCLAGFSVLLLVSFGISVVTSLAMIRLWRRKELDYV